MIRTALAFLLLLSCVASARAAELQKVMIGSVPSLPAAATYIANDKGWYRDVGIDVDIQNVDFGSFGDGGGRG